MWRTQVRHVGMLVLTTFSLVVGVASPASAAEPLRIDVMYNLVSFSSDPTGSILTIGFAGVGDSEALGPVTVETRVTQHVKENGCDEATAEHLFSVAGSTLEIVGRDRVCGERIRGVWKVTGGSGQYAAATGSGVIKATTDHSGTVTALFRGVLFP